MTPYGDTDLGNKPLQEPVLTNLEKLEKNICLKFYSNLPGAHGLIHMFVTNILLGEYLLFLLH